MIDQTIDGRYQVEALLGRGGMGTVYRATDRVENRPVALKFLHVFLDTETQAAQTRFHREFRVLTRLDHPHIMRAYAHGTHINIPYLALEYLAGRTLTDVLGEGSLVRGRLLHIVRQLCNALVYLHSKSIVHRDLKPGNLMLLSPDDVPQVKLMDFGLVRQTDLSQQLTQENLALGTVAYMAPEQAQALPVDFRADLYALGVILYEMVTGQRPFAHNNPAMVLLQQLTMPPPPPSQLNPKLDKPLEQLILELLAKEPAQRPGSAELLSIRLAQLADETAPSLSPISNRADLIPRVPLIGRESALAELAQHWAKAQAGQGRVVLLRGAIGTGKSRLLTEASLPVQMSQDRLLSSHCQERTALPYQPIINILNPLVRDLPTTIKKALPVEFIRLVADTGDDVPNDPGTSDQAEARRHLFVGCWEVLHQATQKQALMLVVEDLQWADSATLDLLGYLVDRTEQARLLLILTYRPEEVEPSSDLAALCRNLDRHPAAYPIGLRPLTRDQTAHFLQAGLGRTSVPDWLVNRFHQATGGNPLFIEETLKALAAEGQVAEWRRHETSEWTKPTSLALQLPQNVLALVERRLQQLSAEDRTILTMAAVLGSEFSFALLQTMAKLDEDDLLDVIDRLLAARLIEELPLQAGDDRFHFAQEALRQALLSATSQRRIRRLHQRAGEAIERVHDAGQRRYWPGLAYHFEQAGDNQRALKYSTLAGDAAAGVYANAEAIGYYRQALELLEPSEAGDLLLTHIYTGLGRSLELNTQFDEALSTYEDMKTLARQLNSRSLELAASMALVTVLSFGSATFDLVRAEALSEKSLSLARDLGDQAAEAKILWGLSNIYSFTNRLETAIVYGERSLALSRQLNLRQQMAFTLNDVARCHLFLGQLNQAQEAAREAWQIWRELENQPMLADNLALASRIAVFRGHYDQALTYSDEAFQISQATNNIWGQSYSRFQVGNVYWDYGQPAEAITVTEDGLRLSELAGFVAGQVVTQATLAVIYAGLGVAERGIELVDQALDVVARAAQFHRASILAAKAQIYLLHGNLTEAETALGMAKTDPNRADLPIYFLPVILADSDLALRQKDYSRTVAMTDDLLATLDDYGMRTYLPDVLYLQGQALQALGQEETAYDRLLEARAIAEAIGLRRMLWPILVALGQLSPNPTEAERLQQQALEIVAYIADHTPVDLRDSFLGMPAVRAVR